MNRCARSRSDRLRLPGCRTRCARYPLSLEMLSIDFCHEYARFQVSPLVCRLQRLQRGYTAQARLCRSFPHNRGCCAPSQRRLHWREQRFAEARRLKGKTGTECIRIESESTSRATLSLPGRGAVVSSSGRSGSGRIPDLTAKGTAAEAGSEPAPGLVGGCG